VFGVAEGEGAVDLVQSTAVTIDDDAGSVEVQILALQADDFAPAPAENCVRAVQAACRYSWMTPPSRSLRRMSR
jgi:hypothetical protein